ncbi:MAG: hypothetical protein O7E52_06975 [Candidatus Poribacteria bacterium]|nr:hypothetical protein [Candidatus Poribacteria bacterium]
MSETLETLANRVDRLEATMQQMSDQLSLLTPQQKPPEKPKTGVEIIKEMAIDKRPLAEGFRKLMKRMGVPEKPTVTLEELRESMVRGGIRPEDNEFSRAIIEEREK